MGHSHKPVVVGLDLDDASHAALQWAARYARSSCCSLHAVHVSAAPPAPPLVWTAGFPHMASGHRDSASELSETMLRRWFAQVDPEPDWTLTIVTGAVGPTMVDLAESAHILVIGTGTHRGADRLVHGSVSHYCLTRARCPVVAVSAAPEAAGELVSVLPMEALR